MPEWREREGPLHPLTRDLPLIVLCCVHRVNNVKRIALEPLSSHVGLLEKARLRARERQGEKAKCQSLFMLPSARKCLEKKVPAYVRVSQENEL